MWVVPDSNARWRGRKHARARVFPGKPLTTGCLADVFWGVFMGDKSVISGVFVFWLVVMCVLGVMIPGTLMVGEPAAGDGGATRYFMAIKVILRGFLMFFENEPVF